jgi:hypothetical protein
MFFSKPATAATYQEAEPNWRRVSLIAGIFFLLTFVHVAILPLYDEVLSNPDFILGAGDTTPVRLGAVFDLLTGLFGIATGVVLFQALRRQQLATALGYFAMRTFEAVMIVVGTLCLLAIVTLRESTGDVTGAEAANLSSIGSALVAIRDWTFFFGPGLCSGLGNGLLLGFLMYRSGLVPRRMALLGVIGGPLSLVGLTFVLFGQWEQEGEMQFLFTLGEIAWELSLSFYLIIKGFRPSPILGNSPREVTPDSIPAAPVASPAAV